MWSRVNRAPSSVLFSRAVNHAAAQVAAARGRYRMLATPEAASCADLTRFTRDLCVGGAPGDAPAWSPQVEDLVAAMWPGIKRRLSGDTGIGGFSRCFGGTEATARERTTAMKMVALSAAVLSPSVAVAYHDCRTDTVARPCDLLLTACTDRFGPPPRCSPSQWPV